MAKKKTLDLPPEVIKEAEEIIDELNDKQKAFCREYVRDWNGMRSYHAAYPNVSDETAKVNASKLLTNTNIQKYLKYLRENLEETCGISKALIIDELRKLTVGLPTDMYESWIERKELDKLTKDQKACIQEISTSIKKVFDPKIKKEVEIEFVKIKCYNKIDAMKTISDLLGYDAAKEIKGNLTIDGNIEITYK